MPGHGKTAPSDVARLDADKVLREEGGLHDEPGNVLDLGGFLRPLTVEPHPRLGGGMSDGPSDGLQQMSLHYRRPSFNGLPPSKSILMSIGTHSAKTPSRHTPNNTYPPAP